MATVSHEPEDLDPPTPIPVPPGLRLIATDLDGTLLLPDGSVGTRTREALDRLRDSDLDFVIVTGRPPRWIAPVVEMTGHRGIGIGANGAVVLDLADGRVTDVFALDADTALEAIGRIRDTIPGAVFAVERARRDHRLEGTGGDGLIGRGIGTGHDVTEFALGLGYEPRWPVPEGTLRGPVEELVTDGDVVKILVRPGPEIGEADDLLLAGERALEGVATATHSNSADRLLEISAPGVSKASTLARVAAAHGVAAGGVAAAGDAPNDLPMLTWAGASYAVGNAHPRVIAAADHVLPPNDAEGVADLIEVALDRRP